MSSSVRSARVVRTAVLFTVAAMAAGACRKKPQPTPTPTTTTTVNTDSINEARRRDSIARAREQFVRDSIARAQADREKALADARNTLLAPVYFDYDQSDLRDDSRGVLEAKLPLMNANASVRIRVSGHTDSRGSDEYNLALGQRRASAVKRFFTERGIDASRIEIASFGEERPTCQEEEESCWSRNRRAEFEVTAGGDNLTLPTSR